MSMPATQLSTTTRYQAINDMIKSIALEQTGLSKILNAESLKIKTILRLTGDTQQIISTNNSVKAMIDSITRLELVLQTKLSLFENCLCMSDEDTDTHTNVSFNTTKES